MANRVLLGNRSTGGYGLYVSKANSNVLTCDKKDLLFDSTQNVGGTGQVYAGGFLSSLSTSQNFLTQTGTTKDSLGYIPLVICSEDMAGEYNAYWGGGYTFDQRWQSRIDFMRTTSSTIAPAYMYEGNQIQDEDRRNATEAGYGSSHACTNLSYTVLKLPCAYGYMTSTYF